MDTLITAANKHNTHIGKITLVVCSTKITTVVAFQWTG